MLVTQSSWPVINLVWKATEKEITYCLADMNHHPKLTKPMIPATAMA